MRAEVKASRIGVLGKYALSTFAAAVFGLIFALCGDRLPHNLGAFSCGVVCWACAASAITDVRSYKIYNVVTYPAFVLLVVAQLARVGASDPLTSMIGPSAPSAILGFVLCFVVVLLPFVVGSGGAGDAKLAAVVGLGLGAVEGVYAVGFAFILAAPLVLTVFATKAVARAFQGAKTRDSQDEDKGKTKIAAPMGPCFLLGAFAAAAGICERLLEFTA